MVGAQLTGLHRTDRLVAESDRRDNAKRDEGDQNHELRKFEWRVVLRRSDVFQGRYLLEGLDDQDERIETSLHLLSIESCASRKSSSES